MNNFIQDINKLNDDKSIDKKEDFRLISWEELLENLELERNRLA